MELNPFSKKFSRGVIFKTDKKRNILVDFEF